MASFARVLDGIVTEVVKLDDAEAPDEQTGAAFLADMLGGDWVQTWYPVDQPDPYPRGCYAGIGFTWDGTNFAPPAEVDATP